MKMIPMMLQKSAKTPVFNTGKEEIISENKTARIPRIRLKQMEKEEQSKAMDIQQLKRIRSGRSPSPPTFAKSQSIKRQNQMKYIQDKKNASKMAQQIDIKAKEKEAKEKFKNRH